MFLIISEIYLFLFRTHVIYIDNNDWFLNPQKLIINDIEMDQYLQSQGTSEYKLYDRKFK